MSDGKLNVLVVDDSALMRSVVTKIIEATDDMQVGATAINGAFALRKIDSVRPDVIVLDLEMPEMNGIEFLKERKKRRIDVPVVILSSIARKGARITMEALSLGASDFILKPSGIDADELHRVQDQIIETLRAYGLQHRNRIRRGLSGRDSVGRKPPSSKVGTIRALAIGVSTGGPNALRWLFARIDPDIDVPIFVVQHMPAGFTAEFAESLNRISPLEIKEAEDGDLAGPGRVFIAPGDRHLVVSHRRLADVLELTDDAPVNGHRPSVDVLFSSVAEVYGGDALAIIMTGMGKDGARSIGEIARAGGMTVAQDEASSVVYGMPRVAVELGHIDTVASLETMPKLINELLGSKPKG